MRYLLMLLLPVFGYNQKIERNDFDKFDSAYVIKTKPDNFGMNYTSAISVFSMYSHFIGQKYKLLGVDNKISSIGINLNAGGVTSFDKNSPVKIQFSDGSFREYVNNADFQITSNENHALIIFRVQPGDPIYLLPVKSIRIVATDRNFDFDVKEKNSSAIMKQLALIQSQPTYNL